MLKERRAYERFSIGGHAVLKLANDTSRTVRAEVCGISFLGVSLSAPEKIEQGINVTFELTITLSDEILSGEGRIAYANETAKDGGSVYYIGVEFLNINKKRIQYFLNLIQHEILDKAKKKI